MTNSVREYFDKVDKVDIQAKNEGYQQVVDILCFCSGSQGYQGYQSTDERKQERTWIEDKQDPGGIK